MLDSENNVSWIWFFEQLKEEYCTREHMCFVSDWNDIIIKVVSRVYENVPHYA